MATMGLETTMSQKRDVLKAIRKIILSFKDVLHPADIVRFETLFSEILRDDIERKKTKTDLNAIKQGIDIVDYIGGFIELKKRGSSYFGLCPFHLEKTPSFSVHPGKQRFNCFGCGKSGSVFDFVMENQSVDFIGALKELNPEDPNTTEPA